MRLMVMMVGSLFLLGMAPSATALLGDETYDSVAGGGPINYAYETAREDARQALLDPIDYAFSFGLIDHLGDNEENGGTACWTAHYYGVRDVTEEHADGAVCSQDPASEEQYDPKDTQDAVDNDFAAALQVIERVQELPDRIIDSLDRIDHAIDYVLDVIFGG